MYVLPFCTSEKSAIFTDAVNFLNLIILQIWKLTHYTWWNLQGIFLLPVLFLAVSMHVRDVGLIPGSGRSPGEGNGNPLQYSCLENSTDRGAWQAEVHGVTKSQTQMNKHAHTHASMHSLSRDQPSFLAKTKYTVEGSGSPE